jgi:hypothetical protein
MTCSNVGKGACFAYWRTIASALLIVIAADPSSAMAGPRRPFGPPIQKQSDETPEFAGRCPPNTPGYRRDLRDWRYGDARDFQCFVVDEY